MFWLLTQWFWFPAKGESLLSPLTQRPCVLYTVAASRESWGYEKALQPMEMWACKDKSKWRGNWAIDLQSPCHFRLTHPEGFTEVWLQYSLSWFWLSILTATARIPRFADDLQVCRCLLLLLPSMWISRWPCVDFLASRSAWLAPRWATPMLGNHVHNLIYNSLYPLKWVNVPMSNCNLKV